MINKITDRLKYWGQLLLLPVYWLSFLVPRNKKIWLFGSTFGRRFADNPRYLYLYVSQHKEELKLRPIWISHNENVVRMLNNEGYEAYMYHSLKGIWFALRGKVYLFDNYSKDINFWQSGGAMKVNLWHGTGNKKANHDNMFDKFRHPQNIWERFITFPRRISDEKPHHYTLATSEPLADITTSAFNTTLEHVIIDGYPRMDAILGEKIINVYTTEEKLNLANIKKWKSEGMVIDFYMPTFRESESKFFEVMDLQKFNDFLKQNNIVFVSKLHPKSKMQEQFNKLKYSNIYNVTAEVDPYTFLEYVDLLTVDYSSVYSEYMLLNRPVVSFFYDYKEYSENTRVGYVSFDEYMPEERAFDMEQLMEKTVLVLNNDIHRKDRIKSKNRMWKYQKAGACKRLVKKIEKIEEN